MDIQQLQNMVNTKFTEQLQNLEQYYSHSTTTREKPGPASVFDQFRDHAVEIFEKQRILSPNQTIDQLIEESLQKAVNMFESEDITEGCVAKKDQKEDTIFQKVVQFV